MNRVSFMVAFATLVVLGALEVVELGRDEMLFTVEDTAECEGRATVFCAGLPPVCITKLRASMCRSPVRQLGAAAEEQLSSSTCGDMLHAFNDQCADGAANLCGPTPPTPPPTPDSTPMPTSMPTPAPTTTPTPAPTPDPYAVDEPQVTTHFLSLTYANKRLPSDLESQIVTLDSNGDPDDGVSYRFSRQGAVQTDDIIVLGPQGINKYVFYDMAADSFTLLDPDTVKSGTWQGNSELVAGAAVDGKVYLAAKNARMIVVIDTLNDNAYSQLDIPEAGYQNAGSASTRDLYRDAAKAGPYLVWAPRKVDTVLVQDLTDNSFEVVPHEQRDVQLDDGVEDGRYYSAAVAVGGKVVFVPEMARNVGVYDVQTKTFSAHAHNYAAGTEKRHLWNGGVAYGQTVYFMPSFANVVGVFNTETDTFSSIELPSAFRNGYKFFNGILLPGTSTILIGPQEKYTLLALDVSTQTFQDFNIQTQLADLCGTWRSGCNNNFRSLHLSPDYETSGKIYLAPFDAYFFGEITVTTGDPPPCRTVAQPTAEDCNAASAADCEQYYDTYPEGGSDHRVCMLNVAENECDGFVPGGTTYEGDDWGGRAVPTITRCET